MKCRKLEPVQLDEERARLEQIRRYVPEDSGRSTVKFRFNLAPTEVGDSLFVIFSNRTGSALYLGSYQSELSITIDGRLTEDKGYDNLEFRLLQLQKKQVCVWSNERGYPYWRPRAEISIALLQQAVRDEDGLTKRHEVTIR